MPIHYLVAVDGGGTSTRLALYDRQGQLLSRVTGGASALGQGVDAAWQTILTLLIEATATAGIADTAWSNFALGLGLSGVHHGPWAAAFLAHQPGFGHIALTNDAHAALLGAHGGLPGVLMIIGTGSAGEAWGADGQTIEVGGWGFPSADEGSGAWLGLKTAQLLQKVLDGRLPVSPLANAAMAICGDTRPQMQRWLAQAGQQQFGRLAPLVVAHANDDPHAGALLQAAADEVAQHLAALDPTATLPICLAGGLSEVISPRLPAHFQSRLVAAAADAVTGALIYLQLQMPIQE